MILGIDEAGRGPWAGPLVVGAVVLGVTQITGLDDSKKLTKKKRESLEKEIIAHASAYGLGWVSAKELDELGMSEALRLATRRAVEQIHVPYHEIIIDGTVNFLAGTTKGCYVTTMPKADALIPSVSAASILAKVARDRYMAEQDKIYPGYGFRQNAGYGVAAHREAIEYLGVTPLHRLSFAPLRKYRSVKDENGSSAGKALKAYRKTTRQIGDDSETVAAEYLIRAGHEIIKRNWRTKWCEVDIVSRKDGVIYFTEVKHRKNDQAGGGMEAITPGKLRQMRFSASLYASSLKEPYDLRLSAIATTGEPPVVVEYLDTL
jgi:ribonuclease HII